MNVKILFFPLAITVVLFLSIFYIKPEIDLALQNRDDVEVKIKLADSAKVKTQNVQTLESSLNANKPAESLVMKYLPAKRDDDRVVDAVNFLSSQSGLTLSSVKLEKSSDLSLEEAGAVTSAPADGSALLNADTGTGADGTAPKEVAAKPKDVKVTFAVKGSYDGIKDFTTKLSKMDRFQKFSSVQIAHANEAEGTTTDLTMNVVMIAAYLPTVKSANNASREILNHNAFAFDVVKSLQEQITAPVPSIEVGAAGASNPFVR